MHRPLQAIWNALTSEVDSMITQGQDAHDRNAMKPSILYDPIWSYIIADKEHSLMMSDDIGGYLLHGGTFHLGCFTSCSRWGEEEVQRRAKELEVACGSMTCQGRKSWYSLKSMAFSKSCHCTGCTGNSSATGRLREGCLEMRLGWSKLRISFVDSLHVSCTDMLQARGKFGPRKLEVLPRNLERLLRAEQSRIWDMGNP